MAFIIKDRVKEGTTTTGTGAITLSGSLATFDTFQSYMTNGDTTYYAIVHTSSGVDEWEVGLGTWNTGNILTRTTVLAGSNGTSAENFSAGSKDVFMTYPAAHAALAGDDVDFANITVTGTVDGRDVATDGAKLDTVEQNADVTDAINVAAAGALMKSGGTLTGNLILNGDPTVALGAATKEYVDTIAAAGIHYHTPVRVEAPLNLTVTYNNGASGVGATLTNAGTQEAITIDGVALSSGDRVLVYEQTDATQNGIYTVTTVGSGSTNWVLTRATDADSYGASDPNALGEGDAYFVKEGATGAGELYVMNTAGTITFGTTDITFTVIAETAVYSAGTGLTLTGTTFAIGQDVGTTANVTFNQVTAAIIGNVTGDVTGNVTGNAGTATKLATARNIALSGDVTGNANFDGTGNISITAVVQDDSHSHVISNVDGLQTALNGKTPTSRTITAGDGLTGGGDLTANRTLNVGAGTGVTVNADTVSIGQDVGTTANVTFNDIRADGGNLILGDDAYSTSTDYVGMKTSYQSGSNDYMIISGTADGATYVSAKSNMPVHIRGGGNQSAYEIKVSASAYATSAGSTIITEAGSGLSKSSRTLSHADTSSQASVNNSNGTVIQDITLDGFGHITGIASTNLDGRYYTETEADERFVNVTGDTMTGNLTVSIPDSGGSPAMTAELDLWGFEGRGAGISIRDQANSASGATDREWFIGTGYNQSGFNIGYSSTATQTSYSAQNKFSLSTSGNAVFAGTAHVNNNQKVFADNYHPNADKWTTARTLTLSGDASGSVTWDGSANAALSVTVANDSHTHDDRYYTESEADSRFVNVTGDTMTGNLVVSNASATIGRPLSDTATATLTNTGLVVSSLGVDQEASQTNVMRLARDGTSGVIYAGLADFDMYRHTDNGTEPNVGLKIRLSTDDSDNYYDALTLESNGNIKTGANNVFHDGYHPNADKWTTARTLTLTGDASGSTSWDGSGNASISVTVADDSHNHTIANVDGLQTALNGKLSISGKAADSNLLDGIDSASFLRSNATDYLNGVLYTRADIRNEDAYRDHGVYGHYDSTKTNHIWSMGSAYRSSASGTNFGNLYGLAYKHTNNATGGTMAGGHQMVWCQNGTPNSAMGSNIWTSGNVEGTDFYVADQIIHTGDTDTYMQFHAADQWRVVTGGGERLEVNNTNTTLATNLVINSHNIDMDLNNVSTNAIDMEDVRSNSWPLNFTTNAVGNDNESGFWVGSNGYPDMRLRRDDTTIRALISSWETSFVSNGLNVTGNLQAFDDIIIGNYSSTDTGSLVLTGSTANKQAVLKCTNGNLHMDSDSGSNMYLNYYSGNGIAFGNGGTGIVAWMGSDGDLWKGSADNTGSKYWHAGNDGSGSGLDADLLDGVQGSGYVNTTGNQTIDGIKTFTGTYLSLENPINTWKYLSLKTGSTTKWDIATNENDLSGALQFRVAGASSNRSYVTTGGYFTSDNQGTLWGSSNDGSGSGLDADLLDGYQLSTTRNAANTVPVRDASGYLQLGWINTTSGSTTNTITKIYGTYNNDNYIRYFTPATLISQQGIWTSGNDGASSGLDADLLDGQHGSYYYPASNPNGYTTYTANQALNTNSNATFNALYVAGEIIHSGDTNTYISFHAEDHWRVVTGGAERLEVNNVQITSTEPIHAPSFHGDGSALTSLNISTPLTGLPTGTDATGSDLIPVYDVSAGTWEKQTITNAALQGPAGAAGVNAAPTGGESVAYGTPQSTDTTPETAGQIYIRNAANTGRISTGLWVYHSWTTPSYIRMAYSGTGEAANLRKDSLIRLGQSNGQISYVYNQDNWATFNITGYTDYGTYIEFTVGAPFAYAGGYFSNVGAQLIWTSGTNSWTSSTIAWVKDTTYSLTHNLGVAPKAFSVEYVCVSPIYGYAVGDTLFNMGERYSNWGQIVLKPTSTTVKLAMLDSGILIRRQDSQSTTSQTLSTYFHVRLNLFI